MKFSYAIDAPRRMIFMRYEGRCRAAHLLACARLLWADPAYSRLFDGYIDLTGAQADNALDDLNALVSLLRANAETGEGRYAAVTTSPVITAIGLLYQRAMAHRHAFAVFSSPEAAFQYLSFSGPIPPLAELVLDDEAAVAL